MPMMLIEKKELQKIVKKLEIIGCEFGIVTEDGEVFGQPLERKKRERKNPGVAKYCEDQIKTLNVGEKITVNVEGFEPSVVQSSISSVGGRLFGKGAIATTKNDRSNCIEVIRYE